MKKYIFLIILMAIVMTCSLGIKAFANIGAMQLPLETIDIARKKVHEGIFFCGGYQNASIANNGTIDILLRTGAVPVHAGFYSTSDGNALGYLYENPVYSSAGIAISIANHNRQINRASTVTAYHTPVLSSTGAQIDGVTQIAGGTGKNAVGGSLYQMSGGIILAPNTDYLFRVQNVSGDTKRMTSSFQFYEPD